MFSSGKCAKMAVQNTVCPSHFSVQAGSLPWLNNIKYRLNKPLVRILRVMVATSTALRPIDTASDADGIEVSTGAEVQKI
jgi:hypothetical protein